MLLGALAGCLLVAAPCARAAPLLFVSNTADDTVSVIDADQDREVKIIAVGNAPQGMALRAHDPLIAVANAKSRFLSLIDPVRLEALPETLPTGMGPESVAFSADGTAVFATCYYDKTLTFIDVRTRAPLAPPLTFDGKIPRQLLMNADATRLFVRLHDEQGAIAVIDPSSRTVQATIAVGPYPVGMALTPDGTRLLVPSFDANHIVVVDLASARVVSELAFDTGADVVAHPFKPLVYSMLNFDGQVLVGDYATGQRVATIELGGAPSSGLISPDGRFLYAVNNESSNVTKIDTDTNTAVVRIAVGAEPTGIVRFDAGSDSRGRVVAALVAGVGLALGAVLWRRRASRLRAPSAA